jgi:hypothetical protein
MVWTKLHTGDETIDGRKLRELEFFVKDGFGRNKPCMANVETC